MTVTVNKKEQMTNDNKLDYNYIYIDILYKHEKISPFATTS